MPPKLTADVWEWLASSSRPKVHCVLKMYMDDSGTNPATCIAGYLGGRTQWNRLERDWKKVLEREGVSEFHGKNFWSRTGEFCGWDDKRHAKFIDDLLKIIEGLRIYPFASATYPEDWKVLSLDERRFLTGGVFLYGELILSGKPSQPKALPFHHCLFAPLDYCHDGLTVYYHFDSDKNFDGWASKFYSYVRKMHMLGWTHKMGAEITFANSVESAPLQAADLLAWEVNRYATERHGNPKVKGRPSFRRAISKLRASTDFRLFDKAQIESILSVAHKVGEVRG